MRLSGKNYIAGATSAEGAQTFFSVDPRSKERAALPFHSATAAEVDRAVLAAGAAFDEIRHYSSAQIAAFLEEIAAQIEALGDELLDSADRETGLGLPRLTGERARTTGQFRAFANLLREGDYLRAIINSEAPGQPSIRQMQFPVGPVAIFAASNFPFAFAVAGGDSASALAAGCPVVVKAHPGHPATSEMFALALNAAVEAQGFPAGTFSLLQGNGIDVGQWLVAHDGIEAVGFTGSLRGGRAIYDAAARRPRPIPVFAEMGSVNPVVITPGALAARADDIAEGLVASVTMGTGQFCTNPGLILLQEGDAAQSFIAAVTEKMREAPAGVLLNETIARGLEGAVGQTIANPDINVLTGGDAIADSDYFCFNNTVMRTSAAAIRADDRLQIEHFGPVTLFVVCDDAADLRATVEALEGNLTSTVHAEAHELDDIGDLLHQLREKAGRVIWNGFPTGVAVVGAMQHGGPYPATTAPGTTSVGMNAIYRFMRPIAFQNVPDALLPDPLKDGNPLGILRQVDDVYTDGAI
ncbi:MAG: aldehyde dehydrogenase (NADP(+)) [Chloroflexota bacterium]|nr:aldehyde dehydrogenase (NADP(+)) [Chloroflexota bacterium]MDE2949097.1 aldehyde dehydrogenase (NADP(+)) [Chloroflexota bacterium]